jgi:hypothetical protein
LNLNVFSWFPAFAFRFNLYRYAVGEVNKTTMGKANVFRRFHEELVKEDGKQPEGSLQLQAGAGAGAGAGGADPNGAL